MDRKLAFYVHVHPHSAYHVYLPYTVSVPYSAWYGNFNATIEQFTDGYKNVTNLRKNNSGLKVLIAIGGWNEGVKKYSDMVSDGAIRKNFVESVIS